MQFLVLIFILIFLTDPFSVIDNMIRKRTLKAEADAVENIAFQIQEIKIILDSIQKKYNDKKSDCSDQKGNSL